MGKYNPIYAKKYREEHKKERNEYNRKYRLEHKNELKLSRIKYYYDNQEVFKERAKNYQKNNKEKCVLKNKLYRISHKDQIKKQRAEYFQLNKDKIYKWRNGYREEWLVHSYKRNDKRRGLECNITSEWLKENITCKPCFYCGDTEKIGCDRIDNNKGHIMSNVVPCCKMCNTARNNYFQHDEMIIIGAAIRQVKLNRKIIKINQNINNDTYVKL